MPHSAGAPAEIVHVAMQVPAEAEVAPASNRGGLFPAMLEKLEFLLSTQATFVNAAVAHCLILFVLFEHFFYTVSERSGGKRSGSAEIGSGAVQPLLFLRRSAQGCTSYLVPCCRATLRLSARRAPIQGRSTPTTPTGLLRPFSRRSNSLS